MRFLLPIVLLLFVSFAKGQSFSYPSISDNGKQVIDFIPSGWTSLDSAIGDLNKDSLSDIAIIIQHADSAILLTDDGDTVITQPRMLLILFQNPDKQSFRLAEKSNTFILNHDQPNLEEPYQAMTIQKGVLKIEFQLFYNMGSWYVTNASYQFRYQQNEFLLIGADRFSFHRATHDFEEYSYNFLTGKRSYRKGNDDKESKTVWKVLPQTKLKSLRTFRQPFTWEVEKDVYL